MKRKIILASASKRRSKILSACGIKHRSLPSRVDEIDSKECPLPRTVCHNAKIKAETVAKVHRDAIVIGADTLVRVNGYAIGKPRSAKEAKGLLRRFSARRIEVVTGLYLIDGFTGKTVSGYEKSSLRVQKMGRPDIDKLFKLLGPYDKAGGFSIEGVGSMLFDDIRGSYFNILGLPMIKLRDMFKKIGLDITSFCV